MHLLFMRGNIMKLKKQFSNLKKGAKKVFVGMLVLCLISTATGIGSIFAYAVEEHEEHLFDYDHAESNGDGTHRLIYKCTIEDCNVTEVRGSESCEDTDGDGICNKCNESMPTPQCEHTHTSYNINADTHTSVCDDCGEELGTPEGHSFNDWGVDPDDASREKRTCSVCDYSETRAVVPDIPVCEHTNITYTYDAEGHIGTCGDCGTTFDKAPHEVRYIGSDAEGNLLFECVCGYTYSEEPSGGRSRSVPKDFNEVILSTTLDFWSMTSGNYPFYTLKYPNPDDSENPITLTAGTDFTVTPSSSDLFSSPVEPGSTIELKFKGNGSTYTDDEITVPTTVPSAQWSVTATSGSDSVTLQSETSGVQLSSDNASYATSLNVTINGTDPFDIYAKAGNGFAVKHSVTNIKNIGAMSYTRAADNYQLLDSSKDITDYYTLTDGSATLQKGYQYEVSASSDPLTTIPETGTSITLTHTGKGLYNDIYYVGTSSQTAYVSEIDVLLNGEPQKDSYSEAVDITANGYTISDDPTDVNKFNTVFNYATPTTSSATGKIDLPLYFMKTGTGRIVKQTITDLSIDDTAGIKILYNGSETKKSFYYGTVRISANGYYVSDTDSSTSWSSRPETFDIFDVGENVKTLYFKNKTTGVVTTVRVTVTILAEIDLPVKYNGDDLEDWYNDDVTITAEGYTISVSESGSYLKKYVMTGSGTVEKELYFKDTSTGQVVDADPNQAGTQPYTIIVCIDRTSPTGVINLDSYSSNAFTNKDAVKAYVNETKSASISASDELSGIDYIHFYVSDTFYSSPSDVKAAISEKSGAWRAYSSSSKPTTVKDKNNYIYAKLVDKAGNETIISLGNILYDTVAPKMTTAKVAPSSTDTSKTIIGLAGTDKLSGINRFKYVFKEKEEGRKYDTPGKDWMFDNGEYVKTTDEKDGTAVASATMDALDSDKTYLFYFIAVDRAGNISEVMTQEVKGSEASSAAPSGSGSGSGSGSNSKGAPSGLTPAPNGIAGGGSGSGKQGGGSSGSGSSKSSKDKKSQSALGDKDREINRNPYIAEATGNVKIGINETSGWNKIASEVNKANKGAVIEVEMAGLSNVSNELFTSMNNRDVQVKLRMADDVEWQIKGEEVPNARSDIDMGVRLGSRNIPEQVLADVTGTNPHVEFSINHNGDFGFVATIAVPVGESNKGMFTTLYHYDEVKKDLEVAGDGRVDEKGYAKFPLTHASDYTVVITPERILTAADVEATSATLVGTEDSSQSSQYLDGARLRLTDIFRVRGSMRIWLFIVALLSATICLIILYLPALQLGNRDDQGDLF